MVTDILKPATIQEALKARALPGTAFLGGGTWLNAARSAEPVTLISLERLGLQSIELSGKQCVVGATATLQHIVDRPELPAALRTAAGFTASRTLRNMMTVGGEVALHPADSTLVPLLLAMEAEVSVAGKRRPVPIKDFLSGGGGGLILSVVISEPLRPATVLAVSRTSHSPRSLVVAACASALQPKVGGVRLVAADCRGAPVRLPGLEASLEGRPLPSRSALESALGNEFEAAADVHASSRYKTYLTRILVADALLEMSRGGKATV
ncbi:MAG: FAD binding domain-containing protein [Spirochaetia bacterium]